MKDIAKGEYSFSFIIDGVWYSSSLYEVKNINKTVLMNIYAKTIPDIVRKLNIKSTEPYNLYIDYKFMTDALACPTYYFIKCKGEHKSQNINIDVVKHMTSINSEINQLQHIFSKKLIHKSKITNLVKSMITGEANEKELFFYNIRKTYVEAEIDYVINKWNVDLNITIIKPNMILLKESFILNVP